MSRQRTAIEPIAAASGQEGITACPELDPDKPLLETRIAGYPFYMGELYWRDMTEGDELQLRREPNHPHDEWAVAVYWQNHKLGYLPRQNNAIVAELMDQGITLGGCILEKLTLPGRWHNLYIRVDFA